MTPYICSHTRTGTHLLASLLYRNLGCGVDDYEKLHYSHSRLCDTPFIHLYRPVLPVMLSIWRCRQHLGIAADVTFGELIRTPWEAMKKADTGLGVFNGDRDDRVCMPRNFTGTLPERWVRIGALFGEKAALNISYEAVIARPFTVLRAVRNVFQCQPLDSDFKPVFERVGWWSPVKENPYVSYADLALLEEFQEKLACLFA